MRSNNPIFSNQAFQTYDYSVPRTGLMTVQGTVSKTFLLLAILTATAIWSWAEAARGAATMPLVMGAAIGGMVVGFITAFKPNLAPWTAPVYAALEGVFLGAISMFVEQRYYKGIAFQAVALTCGTLFIMLGLYATRTIRVTQKLRAGVMAAMMALMLLYLITFVLQLFGVSFPYPHAAGKIGIIFSLFVVGLAAFNLLLDFDEIERGEAAGAPKSMEWYGAFGLIVTLVWLYLEVLRLLRLISQEKR